MDCRARMVKDDKYSPDLPFHAFALDITAVKWWLCTVIVEQDARAWPTDRTARDDDDLVSQSATIDFERAHHTADRLRHLREDIVFIALSALSIPKVETLATE